VEMVLRWVGPCGQRVVGSGKCGQKMRARHADMFGAHGAMFAAGLHTCSVGLTGCCLRPFRIISAGSLLAYIRVPWNAFDCVMVAAGYTQFIPMGDGGGGTGGIRALRALRALRPLRTITRFDSLRTVVVCFLEVRCWAAGLLDAALADGMPCMTAACTVMV
jgi:hypothetical protein